MIPVECIEYEVCTYFNTSIEDIRSKKKDKKIVHIRHTLVSLLMSLTDLKNREIGKLVNRDRTICTNKDRHVSQDKRDHFLIKRRIFINEGMIDNGEDLYNNFVFTSL